MLVLLVQLSKALSADPPDTVVARVSRLMMNKVWWSLIFFILMPTLDNKRYYR